MLHKAHRMCLIVLRVSDQTACFLSQTLPVYSDKTQCESDVVEVAC